MEATNQDFKTDLRDLYISSAQLIDVTPSKNAIIIHVPYRLLKGFQKIQQRLVRELEKKFSGKDVVLVANRRIMPRTKSGSSKARPRSRTLTSVRQHLQACPFMWQKPALFSLCVQSVYLCSSIS